MEQLLLKMARQLDALDEASLLALWEKYAVIVSNFEPTRRWEEAALVLSFIQAKRWKNQLFNHSWSAQVHPDAQPVPQAPVPPVPPEFMADEAPEAPRPSRPRRTGVILPFRPRRPAGEEADGSPEGK